MKKQAALAGVLAVLGALTLSQRQEITKPPVHEQVYRVYLPMMQRQPQPPQKKGVGIPFDHQDCSQALWYWHYNWSPTPLDCPWSEGVPMVWGKSIPSFVSGNSKYLLGFNEPDRPDQSNLSPQEAAMLWGYIEAYYPNKKLISPAPSHENPEWLREWHALAHPRLAGLAVHCYLPTAQECMTLVQKYIAWAQEWNVPEIWVTEFAFQDWTEAAQYIFWMERQPLITHYAWFATRIDGDEKWAQGMGWKAPLFDKDNALTLWGERYQ